MLKRKELVPKVCSRCGNDLMKGRSTFNLPFEKRYICLCGVCHSELGFPEGLYSINYPTNEGWAAFWNEDIKK